MNSVDVEFVNNGLKMVRRRQDANAGHGAANQVRAVVEECDNPALAWRTGFQQLDIIAMDRCVAPIMMMFSRAPWSCICWFMPFCSRLCDALMAIRPMANIRA